MTAEPESPTPKAADAPKVTDADDAPVPKIPRGRGMKLSWSQIVRIFLTAGMLVMLIVMQKPCSDAVSKFVTNFGDDGSASDHMPKPGTVGIPHPAAAGLGSGSAYEHLGSNMSEDEWKAAIARSRAKQEAAKAAAAGSGSGATPAP